MIEPLFYMSTGLMVGAQLTGHFKIKHLILVIVGAIGAIGGLFL